MINIYKNNSHKQKLFEVQRCPENKSLRIMGVKFHPEFWVILQNFDIVPCILASSITAKSLENLLS